MITYKFTLFNLEMKITLAELMNYYMKCCNFDNFQTCSNIYDIYAYVYVYIYHIHKIKIYILIYAHFVHLYLLFLKIYIYLF